VNARSDYGTASMSGSNGPAYRIETARLCIRCWSPADAVLLKQAVDSNMDYLRPWLPWVTKDPEPLEVRVAWLRKCRAEFDLNKDFVYGIFNKDESEVLGGTGLHTCQGADAREIGYWIQEKYQGNGLAIEVASALTKVAFVVDKVKRVHIHCSVDNVKSAKCASSERGPHTTAPRVVASRRTKVPCPPWTGTRIEGSGKQARCSCVRGSHAIRTKPMKLSARNIIKGTISEVTKGQTTAHVRIDIGGTTITASITNEAVDELKLAKGMKAHAVIKASDVMVAVD